VNLLDAEAVAKAVLLTEAAFDALIVAVLFAVVPFSVVPFGNLTVTVT
jgi:hypothetical protein